MLEFSQTQSPLSYFQTQSAMSCLEKPWLDQAQLQRIIGPVDGEEDNLVRTSNLTERERQVLSFVFKGLANKEIAAQLQISEGSVKGTLQQLFRKTGARTRGQLVRIALENYKDQL